MINLNKAYKVLPKQQGRYVNRNKGIDVRIAVHKAGSNEKSAIYFYGIDMFRIFKGHGIIPCVVDNKIAFIIDDANGFTFSVKSNKQYKTANVGTITSLDTYFLKICKPNVGAYILKYDKESQIYYIDLNERINY